MLKIGITGGIGSGKSTVANLFEVLGIPVYNADLAAKRLMNEDVALKEKIKQQFGDDVYKNEKLDNKYLAQIVFSSEEKLNLLNSIVHPATINDANAWMLKQTTPYTLKEAALLFESGAAELLDYVIGVTAPAPLRLQRVMQRDNSSREEVMARMNKQMDEEIKMKLCNFIITNDEQQLLIPQVLALHETLLLLAQNK
ncbi:MAG: dephospho-CoA kinase [Chitinophagaceae bacterium]|nr:dephospho-CoA kinase [Chitinophagaceae bacterium]